MSALSAIHDYLKTHFAGHDIPTLMTHFETAIEAKVEDAVADLKQEVAELRKMMEPKPAEEVKTITLMPAGSTSSNASGGVSRLPAGSASASPLEQPKAVALPIATQAEIAALPPIAQPDAKAEATAEVSK